MLMLRKYCTVHLSFSVSSSSICLCFCPRIVLSTSTLHSSVLTEIDWCFIGVLLSRLFCHVTVMAFDINKDVSIYIPVSIYVFLFLSIYNPVSIYIPVSLYISLFLSIYPSSAHSVRACLVQYIAAS